MGWPFCLAEMRREFQTGGNFFCTTLYLPLSIGGPCGAVPVDVELIVAGRPPAGGEDGDLPLLQPRLLLPHVPLHDLEHPVPLLHALPPRVAVPARIEVEETLCKNSM